MGDDERHGRRRLFGRHRRGDDEPRLVREGDSYRRGERVERERVDPYPEPDGPLQRLLGGPGETWDSEKIPSDQWVDTGDPATWEDRSRERS